MIKFPGFHDGSPYVSVLQGMTWQEIREGEDGWQRRGVPVVYCYGDETAEEKLGEIYRAMAERYWWLQEYWRNDKALIEVVEIRADSLAIDLYNFSQPLGDFHHDLLRRAFSFMASSKKWLKLNTADFVLLDDCQYKNPRSGLGVYGASAIGDRAMVIFPAGCEEADYRGLNCSRFKGILLHELAHCWAGSCSDEWRKLFGWRHLDKARVLPGGLVENWVCDQPERCLTDYAQMSIEDDICESLVGLLMAPQQGDKEKRQFLMDHLGLKHGVLPPVYLRGRSGEDLELPKLDEPVVYLLKEGKKVRARQ